MLKLENKIKENIMTFKEIKELIEVFDSSELAKLSIEDENFKIKLDKNSAVVPVVQQSVTPQPLTVTPQVTTPSETKVSTPAPQQEEGGEYITSPMVGTFYQASAPTSPAYVKVGDKVKSGQVVCIIEAMKIMNEVEAEFDCEILEILVEDGQPVEFDTKLFKVKRV
jgi:acetyl-CoA carboxylase biotin carboxyl carrier protein